MESCPDVMKQAIHDEMVVRAAAPEQEPERIARIGDYISLLIAPEQHIRCLEI